MKRLIQQLFNFAVVGGISTLIDFIVLFIMHEVMSINYLVGTAIAFIVATIFNYWASMRYIFESKYNKHEKTKEFTIFFILSIAGLILTQVLMVLFVERFNFEVMLSKVFVTVFVMLFNFISRKIFLDNSNSEQVESSIEKVNVIAKEKSSFE
ncbi:GtrA family protein [Aerococcaceae bacterium WGS1372]